MKSNGNNSGRGMVISDLHLFARRSVGLAALESLHAEMASLETLVLNGDTFDFRWSTLRDQETTVVAALQWLGELMREFPQCQVHYVLGNHDWLGPFRQGLAGLTATESRLHCHEYWVRLETSLFLHGDCTEGRLDARGLGRYRQTWNQDRQRGGLLTAAYICADRLGLTRRMHQWHFPPSQTVQRLAHYLDQSCPDWRDDTRDCYFGHTHLPFSQHSLDGVNFHNTGSAIRGMGFNPMRFEAGGREGKNQK